MVSAGVDYRTAYQIVGAAVRHLADEGSGGLALTPALLDEVAIEHIGRPLGVDRSDLAAATRPVGDRGHPGRHRWRGPRTDGRHARRSHRRRRGAGRPRQGTLDALDRSEQALMAEARRVIAEDGRMSDGGKKSRGCPTPPGW